MCTASPSLNFCSIRIYAKAVGGREGAAVWRAVRYIDGLTL